MSLEDSAPTAPPPQAAREAQKTPQAAMDTVTTGSKNGPSPPKQRTSHRAAAAVANAFMAAQAQEEAAPLGVVMAKAFSAKPAKHNTIESSSAPAQEQHNNLGMLLCAALGGEDTKKRATESLPPAPKRAKVSSKSNKVEVRGKKRRQAPVYDAAPMEASPIITDLPPLPFTTPDVAKKKYKIRKVAPLKESDSEDSRHCEFCRKRANICVLLHCHACRRAYHAGCFVHAFKALVDAETPILDQMERLQLEAPERRGNIFRCASCKAAFLDFYESDGYLWHCDCPTCVEPDKKIFYRQRKLVQMMNEMELEKQLKKEKKGQGKAATAKTSTSTPRGTNLSSRSRRTRGGSAALDEQVVASRASLEAVEKESNDEKTKELKVDEGGQEAETLRLPAETEDAFALSGDALVQAVRVAHDDRSGAWTFPVMSSRSSSLHASGIMKTGTCRWFVKKVASVQCDCCHRLFRFPEFVHHTDSALVRDAKCADEDPMPFLFVEHCDNTQHSPLEEFQAALRSWVGRQSASNTPTKAPNSRNLNPDARIDTPTTPEPEVDAAMSRLRTLALFKRRKHRSDKASTAARLTDQEPMDFVAQVVCLSPKYVMNMADGALADRVVRSRTAVPDGSFPRKAGWLTFNSNGLKARQITCVCCEKRFVCEEFVNHAGISQTELKKTPRKLLYVVERQDESALMPYMTFAKDLEAAATNKVLDALLDGLQPPPPSPRPLEL
ncbi:TPL-binding domain in jasmonate signaling [Phytophthora infestans]|uniref:TPL-binding domain in jasmonate signaling n=1 Tax=Phytophthora infestans TaxID=4787 RepID=A0A8S9U7R9_PHYIN|nr:TPL-binding domain in jasmonate signaling [Phytophthora infestans]